MNNKGLIVAVAGILIAAFAGYYVVKGRSANVSETKVLENEERMVKEGSSAKESSLRDLMALGGSLICTFSEDESDTSGTMYIGGGKARADVNVSFENKPNYISHMISDGETVYVWQDGQTTGFKTSLADIGKIAEESEVSVQDKTVNVDGKVDYNCDSWFPDQAMFDPPETVEFADFGGMMKDVMESGAMLESSDEEIKTQQCALCESLTSHAQSSCKQALGC